MDGKNYSFDIRGDLNSGYDIILWKQTSKNSLDVHNIVANYDIENEMLTFTSQEAKHALDSLIVSTRPLLAGDLILLVFSPHFYL